jgi:hypothetical protein
MHVIQGKAANRPTLGVHAVASIQAHQLGLAWVPQECGTHDQELERASMVQGLAT